MSVDDEPKNLGTLRRLLAAIDARQMDGEAPLVELLTSREAALLCADEQDCDDATTNYRKPTMSGVEILARVVELRPSAPRVIVSGNADRRRTLRQSIRSISWASSGSHGTIRDCTRQSYRFSRLIEWPRGTDPS